MWQHPVRAKLQAGETVLGVTITTPGIEAAALCATLGFDFLWVEMEHSPITLESLRAIVLATRALPAAVFARVPAIELWTAKRVMDQGVSGVIFPLPPRPKRRKPQRRRAVILRPESEAPAQDSQPLRGPSPTTTTIPPTKT